MAKEKKPSIYVDRGTIGSSDELDEYGVWVKNEPQDLTSASIETQETSEIPEEIYDTDDLDLSIPDMIDLPDIGDSLDDDSSDFSPEDSIEEEDFDLPEMDFDENTSEQDDSFTDITMEEFIGPLDIGLEDSASDEPLDYEDPEFPADEEEGDDFTDVSMDDFIGTLDTEPEDTGSEDPDPIDTGSEDTDPIDTPAADASEMQDSPADLSTLLLMKIAEELASIRTELSSLKKDFSSVRAAAPKAEAEEGGYFDGEDDEKIALTGDELNNILNTADFTEEDGSDATIDLSDDLNIQDMSDGMEDASGDETDSSPIGMDLDMDVNLEENSDLDISIESEDFDISMGEEEHDALPDFATEENEELVAIRESGADPITPAPDPEDAEFLSEEPLIQEDSFDTETSIDLSEAIIDEPDLSSEIHENPLEEPSMEELSIDLELSELDSEELSSTELDSTELDSTELDSEESVFDLDIGEAEISEDTADSISADIGIDEEEEAFEEEIPVSFDTESTEEGKDLSLIPEGFVDETEESASSELVSDPAETTEEDEDDSFSEVDLDTFISAESGDQIEESEEADVVDATDVMDEIGEIDDIGDIGDIGDIEEEVQLDEEIVSESEDTKPAESYGKIPTHLKSELKTVLSYMDQLLESLPDEKIEEFARSEYYDTYKKLFKELGLI